MPQSRSAVFTLTLAALFALGSAAPGRAADADAPGAEASGGGPTLKVGDPAPQLHVSKWLNGKPVPKFETGKVYVIECWATWCGPCVAAIPHVSEMNTKFKDKGVTFIGMNVWEQDQSRVEPFVKKMGEKLNYVVAMDVPEGDSGKTAQAWLTAAGRNGIPCSFVVDQQSRIAWIGHPMAGLDKVVEQVAAGKFDAKAEAAKVAAQEKFQTELRQAFAAQDWDKILSLADQHAKDSPDEANQIAVFKFKVLLLGKKDYKAAYAEAQKLLKLKDAQALNEAAWTIMDQEGVEQRNFDVALKLAQAAYKLDAKDASVMDTLARAHFEKGDVKAAVECQTKAVAAAEAGDLKDHLQETLDKYKKAAAEKK
jgi:thiol-disulfide isomerase/thioredoxin